MEYWLTSPGDHLDFGFGITAENHLTNSKILIIRSLRRICVKGGTNKKRASFFPILYSAMSQRTFC